MVPQSVQIAKRFSNEAARAKPDRWKQVCINFNWPIQMSFSMYFKVPHKCFNLPNNFEMGQVKTYLISTCKRKVYTEVMFTLYRIDNRSAPKAISDSPSVHTCCNLSSTIFVILMTRNTPILKVRRSVSDSFLERSALNVNRLISGSVPIWNGISLSLSWT